MKKLLMIAAIAAFAGSTQAATLNWMANQLKIDGSLANNTVAFLFITAQSSDFGAGTTSVDEVESFIKKGAATVSQTDESTGQTKIVGLKSGNSTIDIAAVGTVKSGALTGATGYYGDFQAGDTLDGFVVFFDNASYDAAENYALTSVQHVEWTGAFGAKSLQFGAQTNATWTPVPEPSVALMGLLGLGMLLKRRKA